MKSFPSKQSLGLIASTVLILSACGGGGSGDTPAIGTLVTGVAATGLAIDKGRVTFSCISGTTMPVLTAVDGSFTVDVRGVTLPCVAKVDYTDTTGTAHQLHSLVKTVGNVNITPVTDMVVANLSATGTAADVRPDDVKGYSDNQISTATQRVMTHLETKGISTANLPIDVIRTKFEAKHGSTHGDSHDRVLDEIKSRFEDLGQTLEDVENEAKSSHSSGGSNAGSAPTGDAVAGKVSYDAMCSSCHGPRISDARNAANTLEAVRKNEGGMGKLSVSQQIADNIATYLTYGLSAGTPATGVAPPVNAPTTQTILFTAPGQQTLGITPARLQATASSGLAVTFASTTSLVCTVSGTTLTLVAAGNCTVIASQAGNTGYTAAVDQTVTFSVVDPTVTTPPVTPPPTSTPTGLVPVAATGKALYSQCVACHGPAAAGGSNVLNGANSALTILSAISSNMGGMRSLSNLTNQNLADIAAYLATPNI